MPVEVRLPTVLRNSAGGHASVQANGSTVREVFEDLVRQFPLLAGQVVNDDGEVGGLAQPQHRRRGYRR